LGGSASTWAELKKEERVGRHKHTKLAYAAGLAFVDLILCAKHAKIKGSQHKKEGEGGEGGKKMGKKGTCGPFDAGKEGGEKGSCRTRPPNAAASLFQLASKEVQKSQKRFAGGTGPCKGKKPSMMAGGGSQMEKNKKVVGRHGFTGRIRREGLGKSQRGKGRKRKWKGCDESRGEKKGKGARGGFQ